MSLLWLIVLILASYRLTRLLVEDSITEGLRSRLAHLPFLDEVVSCHWCAGVWISLFLVASHSLWPGVMHWPLLVLAVAGGQGLLGSLASRA